MPTYSLTPAPNAIECDTDNWGGVSLDRIFAEYVTRVTYTLARDSWMSSAAWGLDGRPWDEVFQAPRTIHREPPPAYDKTPEDLTKKDEARLVSVLGVDGGEVNGRLVRTDDKGGQYPLEIHTAWTYPNYGESLCLLPGDKIAFLDTNT